MSEIISPEEFFRVCPSPSNLDQEKERLQSFVEQHSREGRKIALVTSGGTTIPLEKNTVRFLDNFSGGGRGSASTEYFLENGYAVIFLTRRHSLQPYARHFLQHNESVFLNHLKINPSGTVEVVAPKLDKVKHILNKFEKVTQQSTLLTVVFQTLFDYLFLLREASIALSKIGKNGLIYSAAAVSDFFLLPSQMEEHKIQSSSGPLNLVLSPVPKMLKPLVDEWAPKAYVISFKLETDATILTAKVKKSLESYKHNLVIGNLLQSHKDKVILFDCSGEETSIERSEEEKRNDLDLEEHIILEVIHKHKKFSQQWKH